MFTSLSKASSTAFSPSGISAWIIDSVTGVVRVPSSSGIACWITRRVSRRWLFVCFLRTLCMGGVLGNEWRSLEGFTL